MEVYIIDGDCLIRGLVIGKYLKPSYSYKDTFEDDYTYQVELGNHTIVERSQVFTDKEVAEKHLNAGIAERQVREINRKKEELEKALRLFKDNNKIQEITVDLNAIEASISALAKLKLESQEL